MSFPNFPSDPHAEKWLKENKYSNPIIKWATDEWGEIPADFGKKWQTIVLMPYAHQYLIQSIRRGRDFCNPQLRRCGTFPPFRFLQGRRWCVIP